VVDKILAKQTYFVTATFRDEDGVLVVPTAAWYSIYCETTRKEVLAETSLAGMATSIEIIITATQNTPLVEAHLEEQRLLTLRFTYNAGAYQGIAEHRWVLENPSRL
jgi:hypothetical protein